MSNETIPNSPIGELPVSKPVAVDTVKEQPRGNLNAATLVKILKMTFNQFKAEQHEETVRLLAEQDALRQEREDERANKRNLNRMLTLLGALVIGLVVTYSLTTGLLGPTGKALGPYSFTITILLDSSLAIYSLIRHY